MAEYSLRFVVMYQSYQVKSYDAAFRQYTPCLLYTSRQHCVCKHFLVSFVKLLLFLLENVRFFQLYAKRSLLSMPLLITLIPNHSQWPFQRADLPVPCATEHNQINNGRRSDLLRNQTSGSVSYTHLDVYKRQVYNSLTDM